MDLNLTDKKALVTGASRGTGLAITRALLAEGVRVVGCARTITPALKDSGAVPLVCDVTTPDGPRDLVTEAVDTLDGLDFVVNNVGGKETYNTGGFLALDDAEWQRTLDLNFYSAIRVSRAALPHLLKRRGVIVNISSTAARAPAPPTVDYGAAKAALNALTKALDEEFGPQGVRALTVSPGPINIERWTEPEGPGAILAAAFGVPQEEVVAYLPKRFQLTTGHIAEPAHIGSLVAFLLSGLGASVAGADVRIDDGLVKSV
ncbi:SDR family NAD(P)-dependent oxidoreductase [Streptomyces sp. NPDC057702]|uniref:SDR family NAD(P)-dependent oxidoreductase n=1 Tax=unclassified Streptomyces TaxID=2593676 RepID=UPI00368BDE53